MRLAFAWFTALTLSVWLAGCKDKQQGAVGDEIPIGEYASMTGPTQTFGQSSHEGVLLAIDQINAAGGVLGKKIRLVAEDDRSELTEAVTAVQKLISRDKVVAVLGEVASKRSLGGASVCQKEQIPMLSPASTNPAVTQVGDYIFRICFTDDFQGDACARFAIKKNWKRIAIFTDVANDYSKGLATAFRETYLKSGGQIVAEHTYREGDNDFKAQLAGFKGANVQAVFLPGYYTDVGKILRQSRELGLNVPFLGGDGWDDPNTYVQLGPIAEGCCYTDHYSKDDDRPQTQEFVKAYSARYKNADGTPKIPDAMATLGYDCARVMVDAIRRAGKPDPKAIRDALATTRDFPGASGAITIDPNRNARKPIVVLEVRNGQSIKVDSFLPQ